jgi:hypothetical protein
MTGMGTDVEAVPVRVHGIVATHNPDDDYEIEGYGFTISHLATDTNPTQPLLSADPLRTRAIITSNTSASFIGTPEQMSNISAPLGGTDPGPGARLPSGVTWLEVRSQGEIWVGFTSGACQVGVWVERRVPRGKAT